MLTSRNQRRDYQSDWLKSDVEFKELLRKIENNQKLAEVDKNIKEYYKSSAIPNCATPGVHLGAGLGAIVGGVGAISTSTTGMLLSSSTVAASHAATAYLTCPSLAMVTLGPSGWLGGPFIGPVGVLLIGAFIGGIAGASTGGWLQCKHQEFNEQSKAIDYYILNHPNGMKLYSLRHVSDSLIPIPMLRRQKNPHDITLNNNVNLSRRRSWVENFPTSSSMMLGLKTSQEGVKPPHLYSSPYMSWLTSYPKQNSTTGHDMKQSYNMSNHSRLMWLRKLTNQIELNGVENTRSSPASREFDDNKELITPLKGFSDEVFNNIGNTKSNNTIIIANKEQADDERGEAAVLLSRIVQSVLKKLRKI